MNKIIPLDYAGQAVQFDGEAWFNATAAAERFGKSPAEWLRLPVAKEYLAAIERRYGKIPYVRASRARLDRGGGTWLHPRLAVRFAQWLDIDFAVWCDEQIDALLRGPHSHFDQARLRQEAAASFRVMSEMVKLTREHQGKPVVRHHYANEARLIAWALTGQFASLDRNALSTADLALLIALEERNAVLVGAQLEYAARKQALERFVIERRANVAGAGLARVA